MADTRTAVTVLSGFPGAGTTTLLIGIKLDHTAVRAALRDALLTADEMAVLPVAPPGLGLAR